LHNIPEQPDVSVWSGVTFGVEAGATMLVGALAGVLVGYSIDLLLPHRETIDLRDESPAKKRQIVGELFSELR